MINWDFLVSSWKLFRSQLGLISLLEFEASERPNVGSSKVLVCTVQTIYYSLLITRLQSELGGKKLTSWSASCILQQPGTDGNQSIRHLEGSFLLLLMWSPPRAGAGEPSNETYNWSSPLQWTRDYDQTELMRK